MSTDPTNIPTSPLPLIIIPGDRPPATTPPSWNPPSSNESSSPQSSISTGAVVAIVVVVILVVLFFLCICYCCKKKRRRDQERRARRARPDEECVACELSQPQRSKSEIFSLTFQILFLNYFGMIFSFISRFFLLFNVDFENGV